MLSVSRSSDATENGATTERSSYWLHSTASKGIAHVDSRITMGDFTDRGRFSLSLHSGHAIGQQETSYPAKFVRGQKTTFQKRLFGLPGSDWWT